MHKNKNLKENEVKLDFKKEEWIKNKSIWMRSHKKKIKNKRKIFKSERMKTQEKYQENTVQKIWRILNGGKWQSKNTA